MLAGTGEVVEKCSCQVVHHTLTELRGVGMKEDKYFSYGWNMQV